MRADAAVVAWCLAWCLPAERALAAPGPDGGAPPARMMAPGMVPGVHQQASALVVAIDNLDVKGVRAALAAGADPKAADEQGVTPLALALAAEDYGCAPSFMPGFESPGPLTRCFQDHQYRPSPSIPWKRRLAIARLLLEHGADPSSGGPHGDPPLVALFWNWPVPADELVRLLIASGADVNRASAGGTTALHMAAAHGATSVVRLLLKNGARVDAEDDHHSTALLDAAQGGHRDIVAALLAAGADPAHKDASGDTAAIIASKVGQPAIARMLDRAEAQHPPPH
jgi:ankyrin repeat protein